MNVRRAVSVLASLLLCTGGEVPAQYSAYVSPTFGWYSVAGGLGSYLSSGPLVGLEVLDPHGHFEFGIGAEYGKVGLDRDVHPDEFTRIAFYGTARWLPGDRGGTKRRLAPFLPARIGWTRFSGDSLPSTVRTPPEENCGVAGFPVPCPYDHPRQSGLELAGGAGVLLEASSRFAVEVTALFSLLELGYMRVSDASAFDDKVEAAPLRGTGLSLQLAGRVGL